MKFLPKAAPISAYDENEPIKRLMRATIERAILDAYDMGIIKCSYKTKKKYTSWERKSYAKEARIWLNSENEEPGSLKWCLDGLNIDYSYFKLLLDESHEVFKTALGPKIKSRYNTLLRNARQSIQ